jgi:hypothetical protein
MVRWLVQYSVMVKDITHSNHDHTRHFHYCSDSLLMNDEDEEDEGCVEHFDNSSWTSERGSPAR